MESTSSSASPSDDDLLVDFQSGVLDAGDQLARRLDGRLLGSVSAIAPDLNEADLADEVVQQMWLLAFMRPAGHFDPARGSARSYLRWTMHTAARDVRAMYAPPGQRTRAYRDADGNMSMPAPAISLSTPITLDDDEFATLADTVPAETDEMTLVVTSVDVEALLDLAHRTAEETLVRALEAIYAEGLTITEAANRAGFPHRIAFRRAADRWIQRNDIQPF